MGDPAPRAEPDLDGPSVEELKQRMSEVRRRRTLYRRKKYGELATYPDPRGPFGPPRVEPTIEDLERTVAEVKALVLAHVVPAGGTDPSNPTIWHHGELSYSHDGATPVKVTFTDDCILQVFLEANDSLNTPEIERRSGVNNVSRAVTHLCKAYGGKFAPAIHRPLRRGGGYFICVRPLRLR